MSVGAWKPPISKARPSKKAFSKCISHPGIDTTFPVCVAVPSEKSPLVKPVEVKVEVLLSEAVRISAFVKV